MPRRNRVTPFGDIIATPERGTFLGNRGTIHDANGQIRRPWQVKRWLICVLEFRGRKRTVMTPNRYTHLFFLDEATALAAGHRPCAECRHGRFLDFCRAWGLAFPASVKDGRPRADDIDARLHAERLTPERNKATFTATLDALPDGVMVTRAGESDRPRLLWRGRLLRWTPGRYVQAEPCDANETVSVLTPRSTVDAIRAGYVPSVHESARE